jgi:hypothetical protein
MPGFYYPILDVKKEDSHTVLKWLVEGHNLVKTIKQVSLDTLSADLWLKYSQFS